uniref:Cytochrome P450 n=1 Tax=Stomoxys calcitrans TaxID=35570 RepID=A0A1I8NUE5_STOCA
MLVSAIFVGIVVTLVTYLVFMMKKRLNYWHSKNIACEKPHWFLGNFTGLRSKRSFPEIWLDYYKRFKGTGPFAGFFWFSHPAVFILDTGLMKDILVKDFNKFMDRGFFHNERDDPLTGHLFFLDGLKWKTLRQKVTPTFSSGKIANMFHLVKNVSHRLVEAMQQKQEESNEGEVEVKDLLARFGTDVIGCCAFGIECNSLTNPEAKFHIMGKRLLSEQRHGEIGNAFILNFPELVTKLRWKIIPDEISEFFMGLVRETIKFREENPAKREDFMALLMELKDSKKIKSVHGEEARPLTMDEIAAQVVLFFLAGYETSSTTLGFSLYELALHQDIQNRLRLEVNEAWEQNKGDFSYDTIKGMTYLHQVIQETLRLYPPVPTLNRKCLEDYVVPEHPEYVIKKGMNVIIPVLPLHRDEQYYPQANEFNPDNFLPELCKERDSVLYLPFGEGPRNCIGLRFGEMQTQLALAILIKKFKFSPCSQTQIPVTFDKTIFFLNSEFGIHLKVERL